MSDMTTQQKALTRLLGTKGVPTKVTKEEGGSK